MILKNKKQRMPSEVASILEREIRENRYIESERLPTEATLTERFKVSRATVREAISELRRAELVWTQQGRGTFIASPLPKKSAFSVLSDIHTTDELGYIYELRREVEAGAAALAATYRSELDIKRIRTAADLLGSSVEMNRPGGEYDLSFHYAIADACGNRFFFEFLSFFHNRIAESITTARSNSARYKGYAQLVQHEHQSILEAVCDGDPEQARAAMRIHLSNAMHRLGIKRTVSYGPKLPD